MKKVITLFTMLAFMFNMAVAQDATKPKTATEVKKERTEKKAEKVEKAEKAKKEEKVIARDPNNVDNNLTVPAKDTKKETAAPTKKDGTPDKRYKENKEPKKEVAGPTKKDGTPDKRYKENKTEEKK